MSAKTFCRRPCVLSSDFSVRQGNVEMSQISIHFSHVFYEFQEDIYSLSPQIGQDNWNPSDLIHLAFKYALCMTLGFPLPSNKVTGV